MQHSYWISRFYRTTGKFLIKKKHFMKCKRTFLSEAYYCQEQWEKRFESPLIQKIKPFDFFLELNHKYDTAGKIAAVDVDIFVNSLKDKGHTEDLLDIIYKLRQTPETSYTLPSTHYAIIRYLLEKDSPEQLFEVLNDRLNYGIFPDHHSYNIMMDTFIKNNNFSSAAKIASLIMLQEDTDNPISNALALYSCHKYLEKPDEWKAPEPEKDETEEEVKVRVKYLRNPYFDDHFDLVEPSDLVGKTMVLFGSNRGDTIGRSCQLRGLILYKKYPEAINLIDECKDMKEVVFREVFDLIKADSPTLFDGELSEDLKKLKEKLEDIERGDLKEGRIEKELENDVKSVVAEREESEIKEQMEIFSDWIRKRIEILEKHLAELHRQQRISKVKEMKKELESKELFLTFFDKEEEIELKLEKKRAEIEKQKIDPKLYNRKIRQWRKYLQENKSD